AAGPGDRGAEDARSHGGEPGGSDPHGRRHGAQHGPRGRGLTMAKHGKKYRTGAQKVDPQKLYGLDEAIKLAIEARFAKFDETVELAVRLGVDPRQADQNVRGTVMLPHGTGKSVRVLVIAKGEKVKEAEEAGADFVGGEELTKRIAEENWLDFDTVIATPDMMGAVG